MTPHPVDSIASGQTSKERIILRLRWCLRVGRRVAWLRSSRKLAWRSRWRCAHLRATNDTESSARRQRLPAVGAESLLRLIVYWPTS